MWKSHDAEKMEEIGRIFSTDLTISQRIIKWNSERQTAQMNHVNWASCRERDGGHVMFVFPHCVIDEIRKYISDHVYFRECNLAGINKNLSPEEV